MMDDRPENVLFVPVTTDLMALPVDDPIWWELIQRFKARAIDEGRDIVFTDLGNPGHTRTVALAELKNIT